MISTRTCAYQGVSYAIFSKNSAYVLNEWSTMYVNIAKPSVCSYCESGMTSEFSGVRYAIFSKNSAYVLNEWSTTYVNIAKPVCSYCESWMTSEFSNSRNIRPVVFCKKCILKNSAKLSQKNLYRSLLNIKRSGTLLTVLRCSGTGVFQSN